ncbi:MAG: hypothetical protein JO279_14550 [Verrucomicrobia bacterium]|nr:hypothetical protein [Verrucomicrobiota bacterium]
MDASSTINSVWKVRVVKHVIYRILVEFTMIRGEYDPGQDEMNWKLVLPKEQEFQRLTGAGRCFGDVMFAHHLCAPLIQNRRARFYFTERGWEKVGRFVAGEARKQGFQMRVIRRKNPPVSQIFYRDEFQLALLPFNRKKQRCARKDRSLFQRID